DGRDADAGDPRASDASGSGAGRGERRQRTADQRLMATAPQTLATERRPGRGVLPEAQPGARRLCVWEELGRLAYREAWDRQLERVAELKQGGETDRLLFVEHPHTVTLGRNAHEQNLLVSAERMAQLGIALEETDRGGDVTYHGPG